jgi:hypothetical protein
MISQLGVHLTPDYACLKRTSLRLGQHLESCNIHNFVAFNMSAIQSMSTVSMPDSPIPRLYTRYRSICNKILKRSEANPRRYSCSCKNAINAFIHTPFSFVNRLPDHSALGMPGCLSRRIGPPPQSRMQKPPSSNCRYSSVLGMLMFLGSHL